MSEKVQAGCERPKIVRKEAEAKNDLVEIAAKKEEMKMIRVGKAAPEFTAPAYFNGDFKSVSLADYKGKWVVLCFYPGDFTFV